MSWWIVCQAHQLWQYDCSDFAMISVTLPMWWYEHPGTSIHQSQSQHQSMNRLLAASIPPHWIVTVINWWLNVTSCYNMISLTLPMWWYQCPGTSIHQSQKQHQCMNRLMAASIPPHWIVTVINWWLMIAVVELDLGGANVTRSLQYDFSDFANVVIWTSRHFHTSESKSTSVHE